MSTFCQAHKTSYKKLKCLQHLCTFKVGISDCHKMTLSVQKVLCKKAWGLWVGLAGTETQTFICHFLTANLIVFIITDFSENLSGKTISKNFFKTFVFKFSEVIIFWRLPRHKKFLFCIVCSNHYKTISTFGFYSFLLIQSYL